MGIRLTLLTVCGGWVVMWWKLLSVYVCYGVHIFVHCGYVLCMSCFVYCLESHGACKYVFFAVSVVFQNCGLIDAVSCFVYVLEGAN